MTNNQATTLQDAVAAYRAGRLEEAQALCAALLAAAPRHFDALHLLGVIALQEKAYQRAADLIGAALDITPNALAYNNHGAALLGLKQPQAALGCFDKALELKAGFVGALNNRGNALRALGRIAEAVDACDAALALNPEYAEAWHNRALSLHALKRYGEAADSDRRAIALRPGYADAHNACGLALKALGQVEAALASYEQALSLNPALAEAWNNRGLVLQEMKKYDEALASFDKALALEPGASEIWNNRGAALDYLRRTDEALASYDKSLALDPDFADAWSNRGVTLGDMGRRAEALESYERAIAVNPDHADAHWNMSLCALQLGDFEKGWAGHEWRWKVANLGLLQRGFASPLWLGKESLQGKTILLHQDQGFGDALHFCRYIPALHAQGARVLLEVRGPLVNLLAGLDGAAQVIAYGDTLPAFDCHCPLGSLPAAFRTDLDTIPLAGGYLRASAEKREQWSALLGAPRGLRIGLAWSGNRQHKNDHNRSIALAALATALPAGLEYISLQKEVSDADRAFLRTRPDIRTFGDQLRDFSDTAAFCELVDVIVSVDTSIAHVAGAMARPVWILLPANPDWRWMLERDDSPWYGTARLYRQERAGDWQSVFDKVRAGLAALRMK
jgi:tetratricopeptide (TPR) repeat protein